MTPQQAREIDFDARKMEAKKHMADYKPVNQELVILAGYQAVIDAVTREVDTEYAMKLLQQGIKHDWQKVGNIG